MRLSEFDEAHKHTAIHCHVAVRRHRHQVRQCRQHPHLCRRLALHTLQRQLVYKRRDRAGLSDDAATFVVARHGHERFDRTAQGGRIHYISANSLLNIGQLGTGNIPRNEYKTNYSYGGIVDICRSFNPQAVADAQQLYRRMVFNILIGNVDDHLRNHGFLLSDTQTAEGHALRDQYHLSPAFDLLPHLDAPYMPQSIGVGALGAASTLENALSQCARFFLTEAQAKQINDEVRQAVLTWRTIFRESGVSAQDIHRITPCFAVAEPTI